MPTYILLANLTDQAIKTIKIAPKRINKAIKTDKRNGMMWWHLARDYAHYAELFKRKGDLKKAKENLHKAIEFFKECQADGWLEKAEKKLASF